MKKLISQINKLREEKQAIILAHNYQAVEIQEIADFTGDSLQLSIMASNTDARIIVFCGVLFMAETAAMLNPSAKVLLPALDAGCPMANMVTAAQLIQFKAEYPNSVVVCYVNSSAEVKAESDICCTSSNAVKVIRSIPADQPILFVPDQNLGSWAGKEAGREVITWDGYCPIHHWGIDINHVKKARKAHPDHALLVHPECDEGVVELADYVMSTSGMVDYIGKHDKAIIGTELNLSLMLKKKYPEKSIVPLSRAAVCKNMKKTTLQLVLEALIHEQHHIQVEESVAARAINSLNRMMELSG
ncbi:MAG: quinolinate synthase NadA [Candidatus Cloacimonadaceae bacterium]|nr:quinolinate synthase NadA [Candidatus Cloacimonadaceae bacterium]MDP3114978.1 quinolinate synthase NadA [Candidatus Cloacimonadaceae bacterium]